MRARILRAGVIALIGWLTLEAALLHLIAARIGWGLTIAIMSIKGGLGLLLVGFLALRGLSGLSERLRNKQGGTVFGIKTGFSVASAVLITIPGLVPTLLGIAVLSPSLQKALIRRFKGKTPPENPRDIDLDREEWREVRRKRLPRPALNRKSTSSAAPKPDSLSSKTKPALETKPPSV